MNPVAAVEVAQQQPTQDPIFATPGMSGGNTTKNGAQAVDAGPRDQYVDNDVEFALQVQVKASSELPNGAYFIWGVAQGSVSTMNAYVPENITGRELQIAIHEECLEKVGESFIYEIDHHGVTEGATLFRPPWSVGASSSGPQSMPYQTVDPNKITGAAGCMKHTASVFIRIEFRGGPLNLQNAVQEDSGYQVVLVQKIQSGLGCCCVIS